MNNTDQHYSWAQIDHPVSFRVVSVTGEQCQLLCSALSTLAKQFVSEALFKRYLSAGVWALSQAEKAYPNAATRLVESPSVFAEVVQAALKASGAKAKRIKSEYTLVYPLPHLRSRTGDAIIFFGKLADLLVEKERFDRNPMNRAKPKVSRFKTIAYRAYQLARNATAAPRYNDPRLWAKLSTALSSIGAPAALILMGAISRYSGKRFFQIAELTLFDIYVAADARLEFKVGSKGNRELHNEVGRLPQAQFDELERYIDGPRAQLTGMTLAKIKLLARDPNRWDELKVPVFTEDGVNPIKYRRMHYFIQMASKKAALFFKDECFWLSGTKKYVTFHYLRHEYVHVRLDEIMELDNHRDYIKEIRGLIAYMGWKSGERMLAWYSAHHYAKLARWSTEQHNSRIEQELETKAAKPAVPFSLGDYQAEVRKLGVLA